jgi:hypothetical protein
MNELIDKIASQAGITPEQALKTLDVIKDFVKEKFPMLGGAVDNIFQSPSDTSADPFDA